MAKRTKHMKAEPSGSGAHARDTQTRRRHAARTQQAQIRGRHSRVSAPQHIEEAPAEEPRRASGILGNLLVTFAVLATGFLVGVIFLQLYPRLTENDAKSSVERGDTILIEDAAGSGVLAVPDMGSVVQDRLDPREEPHVEGTIEGGTKGEISYTGRAAFEASEAFENLRRVIESYEADDLTIGIYLADIEGDVELTYNAQELVYSASAIKGPYVLFVAEELIDTDRTSEMRRTITACIANSDNDAYSSIRSNTRHMGWLDYVRTAGVDTADREEMFDDHWYANMSALDFGLLWQHGYDYLARGEGAAEWIAPIFEDTLSSSIHAVLSPTYSVWSKAGWHDGSGAPAPGTKQDAATNDAGIVFSETGPYVLAIVTDAPVDFARLCEAVDAANMCHEELSGLEVVPLLSEDTPIPVY